MLNVGGFPQLQKADVLRATMYNLLSDLLHSPPDQALLETISALDEDDGAIGRAIRVLRQAASRISLAQIAHEYGSLFGTQRIPVGEVPPTASARYLGHIDEHPVIRLRTHLMHFGIEYSIDSNLPIDHIAVLCRIASGLITHKFPFVTEIQAAEEFITQHIAYWASTFFTELESARSAAFYMPVGSLGRRFFALEQRALIQAQAA